MRLPDIFIASRDSGDEKNGQKNNDDEKNFLNTGQNTVLPTYHRFKWVFAKTNAYRRNKIHPLSSMYIATKVKHFFEIRHPL